MCGTPGRLFSVVVRRVFSACRRKNRDESVFQQIHIFPNQLNPQKNRMTWVINNNEREYNKGARTDESTMRNIVREFFFLVDHRGKATFKEIADKFKVDYRTVKKAISHYKDGQPLPRLGRPVIHRQSLYMYIELLIRELPTQFLSTIKLRLINDIGVNLSERRINHIILHELQFRRKRISQIARRRRTERVQSLRSVWRDEVWHLQPERFIFIDEVHFDYRNFNQNYGYFKIGEAAEWVSGHVTRESYSVIMAINQGGIVHWTLTNTSQECVKAIDFVNL